MGKDMIIGLIQVRLGSRRLPGKALKEINGKSILWYLYERVCFSKLIDKVVIATVDNKANLPIVKFTKKEGIECFAGSEQDLVDRIYQTARRYSADIIMKLGGDCPFADPELIDKAISFYIKNKDKYDLVNNTFILTYPDGLDLEVMPFRTINRAWNEIKDPFWREWFSSFIVEHPELYRVGSVQNDRDLSHLRWTVDFAEDFIFVKHIIEKLYPIKKRFLMQDILDLLEKEPWLGKINNKYEKNEAYYKAKKEAKK